MNTRYLENELELAKEKVSKLEEAVKKAKTEYPPPPEEMEDIIHLTKAFLHSQHEVLTCGLIRRALMSCGWDCRDARPVPFGGSRMKMQPNEVMTFLSDESFDELLFNELPSNKPGPRGTYRMLMNAYERRYKESEEC